MQSRRVRTMVSQGVRPINKKPRRMKGFWRAVKSGQEWAVELNKKTGFSRMFGFFFLHMDEILEGEWMKRDTLFEKMGKSHQEIWQGGLLNFTGYPWAKKRKRSQYRNNTKGETTE